MERFVGTLRCIYGSEGSKSEGYLPYLIVDMDSEQSEAEDGESCTQTFQLYREGVLSLNDSYFEPFNEQHVEVEGVIKMEKWIETHLVKIIEEEDKSYE